MMYKKSTWDITPRAVDKARKNCNPKIRKHALLHRNSILPNHLLLILRINNLSRSNNQVGLVSVRCTIPELMKVILKPRNGILLSFG